MNDLLLNKIEKFIEIARSEELFLSLFAQTDLNELDDLMQEIRCFFNAEVIAQEEEYEAIA